MHAKHHFMYLNAILDVDKSSSVNKVFHYVLLVLPRCNMQRGPLMKKREKYYRLLFLCLMYK